VTVSMVLLCGSREGTVLAGVRVMTIRFLGFGPRARDEVPLGIESALPGFPAPSKEAQRRSRMGWPSRLLLAVALVLVLLGVWHLGRGLYVHIKTQVLAGRAVQPTPAWRQAMAWPWAASRKSRSGAGLTLTPCYPYEAPCTGRAPRRMLGEAPDSKG
jgi:hypothetical protein